MAAKWTFQDTFELTSFSVQAQKEANLDMDRIAKLETENADLKKKLDDVLARLERFVLHAFNANLILDYRTSRVNSRAVPHQPPLPRKRKTTMMLTCSALTTRRRMPRPSVSR